MMLFTPAILVLFLDQLSKHLAAKNLILHRSVPIIKGIFHLTLIHNRGAAFGILKNQAPLFIFISLFAIILIYFNLKKSRDKENIVFNISLALILGGALGNLIDRLFLGYVIDFLDFRIWPVFNVADSAITIGAILLGWSMLIQKEKRKNYASGNL